MQCCFEDCTFDQYSPCRSCKTCFCTDEDGYYGNKKTNLKTVIPNAAEETVVPEALSSEEDLTNVPQEGLIQENLTTAQQDLITC
jgi:hypothetical protein